MPRQGLKQKFVIYLILLVVFISFASLAFFIDKANVLVDLSVAGVLCILGIFMSFFIVSRLIKPIKVLEMGSRAFAKGDFGYRIKIKTGDEIEDLAEVFNKMAQAVGASSKAMEGTKEILEIKVGDRTEELQELADKLEDRVERRTKQLSQRVEELERFHRLTVGRELKMIELKKEIKAFKEGIGTSLKKSKEKADDLSKTLATIEKQSKSNKKEGK